MKRKRLEKHSELSSQEFIELESKIQANNEAMLDSKRESGGEN